MLKLTFGTRIAALVLLLILFSGLCAVETAVNFVENEAEDLIPPDSIFTADGTLKVLPRYTDVKQAFKDRTPRYVNKGYYLIVKKDIHKLFLYKDGVLKGTYSVATGRNPADKTGENDYSTPEGHFHLLSLRNSTDFIYVPPNGIGEFKHVYGPWYFDISTNKNGSFSGQAWKGIAIHGTNSPGSIGRNVSHGCIRLKNKDITLLKAELAKAPDIKQVQVDILP
jgi:hypothetical protein